MKNYSLPIFPLAVLTTLLLTFSSCKKEESDNPNIVYRTVNKTITCIPGLSATDTIDVNNDGLSEMYFVIQNLGADTGIILLNSNSQPSGFAVGTLAPIPIIRVLNDGETTPLSASAYMSTAYPTYKASGFREGLLSGDAYIAFRFTTGSKYNYGWMKISLNSAFTELKVIEYAYNLIPDEVIEVGAK
ncbi:MAG: hypothetical protein IPH78_14955 [Bacteroidetes bacterium]|nr:hypothetical protein [Bacteroidota bacterium]MBK8659952.1 hypothetical protein [Bacteroidota bacterium]